MQYSKLGADAEDVEDTEDAEEFRLFTPIFFEKKLVILENMGQIFK